MLLKRVMMTRFQLPDSFPHYIEQKFGEMVAKQFELNCARYKLNNVSHSYYIEPLPPAYQFKDDVEFVNQIISYERLVYYAKIQERNNDPIWINHIVIEKTP